MKLRAKIVFENNGSEIYEIEDEVIGIIKIKNNSGLDTFCVRDYIDSFGKPAYLEGELTASKNKLFSTLKCKLYFIDENDNVIAAHHKHK